MPTSPSAPALFENPETGERKYWSGSGWVMLPNVRAPGSKLLPSDIKPPNPSAAAAWGRWSDDTGKKYGQALTNLQKDTAAEQLLNRQQQQRQGTGGVYGVPLLGTLAAYADPELRRLDQLQASAARGMREAGEGSMSDFDAKMFLTMAYSKGLPMETNRAVLRAQRVANAQTIERKGFNDWYYQTYNHRDGADEAWAAYANSNPILDPKSEKTPVFNPNRQTWRQYFGVVRGPLDTKPSIGVDDVRRASQQPAFPQRGKPGSIVTNTKGERAKWDAAGTQLIPIR